MTQALAGVWYAQRRRIPCWIYVQDLWPENIEIVTGIHSPACAQAHRAHGGFHLPPLRQDIRHIPQLRAHDTAARAGRGGQRSAIGRSMPGVLQPCAAPDARIPQDGRFRVIFTGNVGMAQGLDILPETAALLKASGTAAQFVIVGDGRGKGRAGG